MKKSNKYKRKGLLAFLFRQDPKNVSWLGRQRQICLAIYMPMVVVAILANLFGLSGPGERLAVVMNCVLLLFAVVLFLLFVFRKLSIVATLALMGVVAQFFTSFEMLLCALIPSEYSSMLIVANMTLLAVNIFFFHRRPIALLQLCALWLEHRDLCCMRIYNARFESGQLLSDFCLDVSVPQFVGRFACQK